MTRDKARYAIYFALGGVCSLAAFAIERADTFGLALACGLAAVLVLCATEMD